MSIHTVHDLGPKLCKALGLPKGTRSFELRCAVGEPVIVKCEYMPEKQEGPEIETLFAEYQLVAIGGSAPVGGDPVEVDVTSLTSAAKELRLGTHTDAVGTEGCKATVPTLQFECRVDVQSLRREIADSIKRSAHLFPRK